MKKHKTLIVILVIILAVIIIMVMFKKRTPVHVSKAAKGTITEYVDQRAVTSLPHIYHITMPFNARIQSVSILPGTAVKKNQSLAELVQADILTEVAKAKAKVKAIKAQIKVIEYNDIERTAHKESLDWIKAIEAVVGVSERRVKASENVYKYAVNYRNTQILSGLAVSSIKKNQAEMEAAVKQLDMEGAILTMNSLKIVATIFKLLPIYINEYLTRKSLEKGILESQLAEAEATLNEANRHMKMSNLTSPIDGIVLKRYISNERFLPAGTNIVDIGDLNELEVTADVLSTYAPKIKPGDNVDIYGYAIGNAPVKGKVIRIEPEGFTKISSLGVEEQRVNIKINIDKNDLLKLKKEGRTLGYKYRVYAKIFTAIKNNAVIVPRTALLKDNNGNWQIFKVQNSKALLTNVDIGLMNDEKAEITKGIEANDLVILAPPASLKNNQPVDCQYARGY